MGKSTSVTTDERADRLQLLGALAAGLAHEIKNPLSTLSMNLQLLQEDVDQLAPAGRAKVVRRIDGLQTEVQRLQDILNDFIRFAGRHRLELETVDLGRIIDQMLDFVEPEAVRQGITIRRYLDGDGPELRCDPGRIKQALLNVLINAQQALADTGGEIVVRTRRDGSTAVIEVIDNGPGMTPDILEHIWDVYYSSKQTGTGLGLPTTQRIIEEHDGTITAESEPGHGTCFTIRLPLDGPAQPQAEMDEHD